MPGLFITFEGPDGAGKTTQIQRLADALSQQGLRVTMTREPGGTRIGDQIRSILLAPEHTEMSDPAEVLLYASSRAQHVQEKIIPVLKGGGIVLCDRFVDASIAYQAYGLGLDRGAVAAVNQFATAGMVPDRTYMLDVPVSVSRERLQQRVRDQNSAALDRIEQKGEAYHERVRQGFREIAAENPGRVLIVDANREPDLISQDIAEDCQRLLKLLYYK